MARLSQQALSDAISAVVQASDNADRDVDLLEEALLATRNRVRASGQHDTLAGQRTSMARCLMPLSNWIDGEADLMGLADEARSDLMWNMYAATMARTQGADSFPLVTGNLDVWNEVVSSLHATAAEVKSMDSQAVGEGTLHYKLAGAGLCLLALDKWIPSDRWRVYSTGLGLLLVGLATMLWYFGWTGLPGNGRATARSTVGSTANRMPKPLPPTTVTSPETTSVQPESLSLPQPADSGAAPAGVPPVPSVTSQVTGQNYAHTGQAPMLAFGSSVQFRAVAPYAALAGQRGTIVGSQDGAHTVLLESGLTLQQVAFAALEATPQPGSANSGEQGKTAGGEFYAPFSVSGVPSKLQAQAGRLKDALTKANALASSMPAWATLFWQAVKNEKDIYSIEPEIGKLLQSHGYIGEGTIGPPRSEELKKALLEIETLGGPMHGSGGSFARIADVGVGDNPEQMAWHLKLPADLQRAAPELYRNLRSEGAASVRQWVNEQHPTLEMKQTATYQDLFMAATIIDFELADCRSESAIMHKLGTSDTLEIHLRKLGSFIYFRRTKDKSGANRMLGIRAPGSGSDIAPKWLLDDANAHSKLEWQRAERGQKMSRFESGSGSSGGGQTKYAGKFRGRGAGNKGGGRGKSSPNKTQG